MHPPPLISSRALVALALAVMLALDGHPANAQSNPLEKLFGIKKYEDPPTKKKKATTKAKKKPVSKDENDDEPAPTPRKKSTRKTSGSTSQTEPTSGKSASKAPTKSSSNSKSKTTPSPTPTPTPEPTPIPPPEPSPATTNEGAIQTSSLDSSELKEFATQPDRVKQLLESALALTRRNLTYTYGSADPSRGGMDCSGFIYYVLQAAAFPDAPRQANEQYIWVRKKSVFWAVLSKKSDTFEIKELQPGDLMFWTGTYDIDRDPPVTHTMIYLGTSKKTGKTLMVGSSDGRTYEGAKRNGVSVFDFHVASSAPKGGAPANGRSPIFAGYGPIPGMR